MGFRKPDAEDWFVFVFAGFFAGFFALLRYLTRGFRSWGMVVVGVAASGFWGGVAAWVLTSFSPIDGPMLGALSAVFGWIGYEAVAKIVSDIGLTWLKKAGSESDKEG